MKTFKEYVNEINYKTGYDNPAPGDQVLVKDYQGIGTIHSLVNGIARVKFKDHPSTRAEVPFHHLTLKSKANESCDDLIEDRYDDSWAKKRAAENKIKIAAAKARLNPPKPAQPVVDHAKIANHIETAIGNSFPDADPHDELHGKLRKMGIPEQSIMKHLDIAAKKHLGSKDFHTHLKNAWNEIASDNPAHAEHGGKGNPWK